MYMNYMAFMSALVLEESKWDFEEKYDALLRLFASGVLHRPVILEEFSGRILYFDYSSVSDTDTILMKAFEIGTVKIRNDGMLDVMTTKERMVAFKGGKFVHRIRKVCRMVDLTLGDYVLGPLFRDPKSSAKIVANERARKAIDSYILEKYPPEVFSRFKDFVKEGIAVPISLRHILNPANTNKAEILSMGGKRRLPLKSLNRYPLGFGLALRIAQGYIPKDAFGRFTGTRNSEVFSAILKETKKFSQKDFAVSALAKFLYPSIQIRVATDYLEKCKELNQPADVSIKNEEAMNNHILLMRKDSGDCSNLEIAPQFLRLAERLEPRYQLLRSNLDLEIEGIRQHNCVATYGEEVKRGECAIFTLERDGKRYTIEIRLDKDCNFFCNQFLGVGNKASEECLRLKSELMSELDSINTESALVIR